MIFSRGSRGLKCLLEEHIDSDVGGKSGWSGKGHANKRENEGKVSRHRNFVCCSRSIAVAVAVMCASNVM